MTRIIGGSAGGRRITAPSGQHTRPTTDRVREALFSSIEAWCGSLQGLRFLDLYAGSGAIGLEAWSRGAGVVTLVESDRRTARLIGDNARALGYPAAHVVAGSVGVTLGRPPTAPYDVVFLDPPYPLDEDVLAADLAGLDRHGWLVPGAMVVVERSSRSPEPTWPAGDGRGREALVQAAQFLLGKSVYSLSLMARSARRSIEGTPIKRPVTIEIGAVQHRLSICGYYEGAVRNPSRNIGASGSKTIAVARRAARSARCRRYRRRSGVLVTYRPRLAVAQPDARQRQGSDPGVYAQSLPRKARGRSAQ